MDLGKWRATKNDIAHDCVKNVRWRGHPIYNMDNESFECVNCGEPVPVEILDVAVLAGHNFSTYTGYYGG